jgi:hypothetical protein
MGGLQGYQVHGRLCLAPTKCKYGAFNELALPFGNLVNVQVKLLAQLAHSFVFAQCGKRHLCLEFGAVRASRASSNCLFLLQFHNENSCLAGLRPTGLYRLSFHLSRCSDLSDHFSAERSG